MKKFYIALTALVIGILLPTLCGCATESKAAVVPAGLRIEADMFVWDESDNAAGYVLEINGKEYNCERNFQNITELELSGIKYDVRVKACGDGNAVTDSAWSEILSVAAPRVITSVSGDGSSCVLTKCADVIGLAILPSVVNGLPLTEIGSNAFADCKNVDSVIVPNSVVSLRRSAFENCKKLKRAYLPETVTNISDRLFYACDALEEFVIPENVTAIGSLAFSDCVSLKRVAISRNVERIDKPFLRCYELTELTVDKENQVFESIDNCIIRKADNVLLYGCAGSKVPDVVTSIDDNAFSYSGISSFTVPSVMTDIPSGFFWGCKRLTDIEIPNTVTEIGEQAFAMCSELNNVTIPSSVSKIGPAPFRRCTGLTDLSVEESNPTYKGDGNCIISKENNALVVGCVGSVIPDYVLTIEEYAFFECYGLTEIVIPKSVTSIRRYAFYSCIGTEVISVPDSVVFVAGHAFDYDDYYDYISVTLPENLKYTGNNIFSSRNSDIRYDDGYAYVYSTYIDLRKAEMIARLLDSKYEYETILRPTRKGYTFMGYAATPDGAVITSESEVYRIDPVYRGNIAYVAVYPVWQPNARSALESYK